MTREEAITELETIKRVYANMSKEYQPCVESFQMAIDLLRQADDFCSYGEKGIKFRKATMIKLRELAEIADRLDAEQAEPTAEECSMVVDCDLFKKDGTCIGCYRYDTCHSSPDCPWK